MLNEESQVSTVWLQCSIIFSLIWGVCSTLVNESRQAMDVFFRKILVGNDPNNPRPKVFKLTKQQIFPDRNTIFDWVCDKKNNYSWIPWMETSGQVFIRENGEKIVKRIDLYFFFFF